MVLSRCFARTLQVGLSLSLMLGCTADEPDAAHPNAGSGGGGTSGSGTGGTDAGTAGTLADSGSAGAPMGGSVAVAGMNAGGVAGAALGGMAGEAASAGTAGSGGTAGVAGSAGSAGETAGTAGTAGGGAGTAGETGAAGNGGSGGGGAFTLTSPAFDNVEACSKMTPTPCDVFPNENISFMQNMNISPELNWSGAPAGTQSFAVVLQDLSNGFAHWVLWNIPGTLSSVPANVPKNTAMPAVPAGSQQCNANFAAGDGYFGPGSACNVYEFVLYALSASFSPTPATDAAQVRTQLQMLGDRILGTASLRGRSNYMMNCND